MMFKTYKTEKNRNSFAEIGTIGDIGRIENKGTKTSGWWNPDHAARMAVEGAGLLDAMSGSSKANKKFLTAILSNKAVENAIVNFNDYHGMFDGMTKLEDDTSFLKNTAEIYNEKTSKNPGLVGKLSDQRAFDTSMTANAMESAYNSLKDMHKAIDHLGDYAMASGRDDFKSVSLPNIEKELRTIKYNLDTSKLPEKLDYVDNKGKAVSIQKCLDSSYKALNDYYKEMKQRFPLG